MATEYPSMAVAYDDLAQDAACFRAREAAGVPHPTITQVAWEAVTQGYARQAGVAPEHAEEIQQRMQAGASKPDSRPAHAIAFRRDQMEEALDGFAYACGDLLQKGKTPARLVILAAWADLLTLLELNREEDHG